MMRRLLKFMNYAAQLMALIDIGKQICEHLASKKQPTIQKRRTAKQLINNHPAVLVAIPSGPFFSTVYYRNLHNNKLFISYLQYI